MTDISLGVRIDAVFSNLVIFTLATTKRMSKICPHRKWATHNAYRTVNCHQPMPVNLSPEVNQQTLVTYWSVVIFGLATK